ncbi:peptidylprolyl isomerase [Synoicihabitans lomoniglobus]|uniref:peptidylprolyl isomerase n=1 Tax=Synoicihabitans lomoniglobus TaxID=2909285 RepID=A0AAF0CNL7_9BACT|nr:peptidylprolyl isomerase [Opitutaceae bacterium LMO-M01]WED65688.1 peptidylprolyl isomerase [Opitutaceae bacterium LMO-M01]
MLVSLTAALRAQSLAPIATGSIAPRSSGVGAAAVEVDLTSYFTIDGVTAQIVRFDTIFGDIDVEMLPAHAPNHVANFLSYVDDQLYDNSIIHRAAPFGNDVTEASIIQGGSHYATIPLGNIAELGEIDLEYSYPNARGTLAAARTAEPNSAQAQWYFNVADNTEALGPLDTSPGYSVYGRIIAGIENMDTLASINWFSLSSSFPSIPLRFYNGGEIAVENLVIIHRVLRVPMYPASADAEAALTFTATSSAPGVVNATVVGSTLQVSALSVGTATVTITATNGNGQTATQQVVVAAGGIEISAQPQSVDLAVGGSATVAVTATSSEALSYQWYRHQAGQAAPVAMAGATGTSLTLSNVQSSDMGYYFVRISNGVHEVESDAAVLTVSGGTSRLSNLSTRGRIAVGGSLTPGFVLRGDGEKPLVMRGIGPQLISFGLSAGLGDPIMDLIPLGGSEPLLTSDNWGTAVNAAALVTTSASVGAFALETGSLDAAVLADVPLPNAADSRGYTLKITSTNTGLSGIALAEVYDPEPLGADVQLINVSALGFSGTGIDALVPGFVIDGDGAKTMLIRVVGPSLESFGVAGLMTNPKLRVVPLGQSFTIARNDNWAGAADLQAAFTAAGAFNFASTASLDAAVVVRLPPGGYTVVVEGADGGTGTVLVEAYDLD